MYWYEEEVLRLEREREYLEYKPLTLFYGSSSIRLWDTLNSDFHALKPVNLGFGGSTLAACTWFFERVVVPYPNPQRIVIYAGDNDLGDGRHPEEVFIFFLQLAVKIEKRFGSIPCFFISIKPSIARWDIADCIKYTNNLIENEIIRWDKNWKFIDIFQPMLNKSGYPEQKYFTDDGLHLNIEGYELWKRTISAKFSTKIHNGLIFP